VTTPDLSGQVVAVICTGSEVDRAIAVGCAEAGALVAIATVAPSQQQEFATASIANEIWALGRDQFNRVLDSTDPAAVAAFADEVWDRFRRCDVLVAAHDRPSTVPFDELGLQEFVETVRVNLGGPFLAAQAFGRLMERNGGGRIVFVDPGATGDVSYRAARSGLGGLAERLNEEWLSAGVRAAVVVARLQADVSKVLAACSDKQ
jgi:NAD(P)-dependent dehydrogenase (short-subunit alcohol dehydrogenase family)